MSPSDVLAPQLTGDEIIALSKKHTIYEWSAQSKADPIPVARAKGICFWTPEGKRYIDFNSQLMCVAIGHGDERVVRAIQEQAAVLAYANPFMATEPRATLGAKLAEITPGDIDAFFFTNGGADANGNAIEIARWYTARHKIFAFYRSYHGGTAGAMSLTRDPRRWAAEPGISGIVRRVTRDGHREEIFGPVAGIHRVTTLDDAFRIMEAHPNANATSIFTSSGKAAPMAYFPFGGARDSFFGDLKVHGRDAFQFYTDGKVTISRWY